MNMTELAKKAGFTVTGSRIESPYIGGSDISQRLKEFASLVRAEALAEAEITTPDVCGEVCARAKLCYGCGNAFDEALAEPVKQEPVAWTNYNGAVNNRLKGAPVDAKAIRAEAYQQGRDDMKEEAAKVCEEGTALIQFQSTDCYSYAYNRAAAIRGLK